jgi:hypothetical protein
LRTLRALINKAIKEEVCAENIIPSRHSVYQNTAASNKQKSNKKEEINKIRDVDLSDHPQLVDARNYFIFSYYCRGINFIDLAQLKWKDHHEGRLIYTRKKPVNFSTSSYWSQQKLFWSITNRSRIEVRAAIYSQY